MFIKNKEYSTELLPDIIPLIRQRFLHNVLKDEETLEATEM